MLEHKGYLAKVEFDDQADLFHGEVIGIRDVITFQGSSVDELRTSFRESVDDYLDFCKQRGEQPNKPCSGRFLVRLSPELHRKLSLLAAATGKSLNTCVVECLDHQVAEKLSGNSDKSQQPTHVG